MHSAKKWNTLPKIIFCLIRPISSLSHDFQIAIAFQHSDFIHIVHIRVQIRSMGGIGSSIIGILTWGREKKSYPDKAGWSSFAKISPQLIKRELSQISFPTTAKISAQHADNVIYWERNFSVNLNSMDGENFEFRREFNLADRSGK